MGDPALGSVPPPGWSPTLPPAAEPVGDTYSLRADAAVRWRIRAAVIDSFIVYGGYLLLCAVMRWPVRDPSHLWLLIFGGIGYHFAFEARDGQTLGKRRYGIRVVSSDGTPAGPGSIAIRSVLRIIDQLPVCYASGLVSMVRTGPDRRQRIGDIAAGTKVIAFKGDAVEKGTPAWMLPAASLTAVLISAATAYAVFESGHQPLTETERAQFIAGCQNSAGQTMDCECFLTHLEAEGYGTRDDLQNVILQARAQAVAGQVGGARASLIAAVRTCRHAP